MTSEKSVGGPAKDVTSIAQRANQHLAHTFFLNLIPLLEALFPKNISKFIFDTNIILEDPSWFTYYLLFKQMNFETHLPEI